MDKESLQASISHFDQCEKYRVEKTLRRGNIETTEVVYQIAADGSQLGPFIRKRFSDPELWDLYKRIHVAQINGLREPALPRIHEVAEDSSGYYSIVEYVKGPNLREAEGLEPLIAFEAACSAVKALHERFDPPIIHRDIKPDNVIAVPEGVVLIDFGAARSYDEGKDRDTHPYATRDYAPPEQFGYAQTDARSDIYSLGMLLVFLETGKDPDFDIKGAIRLGDTALMEKGISAPAAKTIVRACAFDPKLRFNSIDGMLDFLHAEIEASGTGENERADCTNRDLRGGGIATTGHASASSYAPPEAGSLVTVNHSGSLGNSAIGSGSKNPKSLSGSIAQWRDNWNAGAFRGLGIAWDVILLVVWAFFMIVAIWMCFGPDPDLAHIPVWLRVVEYIGVVMSLLTVCLVMLLDWRPIRSIGNPSWPKRRHIILPIAVVFIVCLIITSSMPK